MNKATLCTDGQYCLNLNLRKATRALSRYYAASMQSVALERTQFSLLSVISKFQQVTTSELAEVLTMDQTTVTRNVQLLKRNGYVEIAPGADKRTRLISLSDQGRAALKEAAPFRERAQTDVVEALGVDKSAELLSLLAQIVDITAE